MYKPLPFKRTKKANIQMRGTFRKNREKKLPTKMVVKILSGCV